MFICLLKKEIFTRHTEKNIPMIYRLPYPWYLTPYQWYFDALPMAFWPPTYGISPPPPYPWYFDPPTHGILTPLSMVIWPPSQWYIEPPIHGILTPLSISWLEMRGSKYHGVQCSIQGGQYIMDENWPPESLYHGGQNTIWHRSFLHSSPITGFVTRLTWVPLVEQEQPTFPEHSSSPRFLVGFVLLDL